MSLAGLEKLTDKDVPLWNFKGIWTAKVVDVHDGDTCRVIFQLGDKYAKVNVRMEGYDAPELNDPNPDIKKLAFEARDLLRTKILDKIVQLNISGPEKYGRSLATVTFEGENINKTLALKYGHLGNQEYLIYHF